MADHPRRLKGRAILVTGASSGIGLAVTTRLLEESCQVLGLSRNPDRAGITHDGFRPLAVDLSDLDRLPAHLETIARDWQPDGLVFCAGRGRFGSLEEFSWQQIRQLIDLNFTSTAMLARAFIPAMKQAGRGDLVFIGSEAALSGGRRGAVYSASKFALRGFAQSLREECAKNGVKVSIINPGMVNTPFFDELNVQPGAQPENYLLPEDVADAVQLVLASRPGTLFEEINLSPLKKVVRSKGRK